MKAILATLALVALLGNSAFAVTCGRTITYTEVDEADYSWTYSVTPGAHPLGYDVATYMMGENVCINFAGVQGKMIEIAIETFTNGATACISDSDSFLATTNVVPTQCGVNRVSTCFDSPDDNTLSFFVYTTSDETDFTFFYRIRTSNIKRTDNQNDAVANAAMWCAMLGSKNTTAYPKDLLAGGISTDNFNTNPIAQNLDGSAASTFATFALMPLIAAVAGVFAIRA
ncbi:hypothetical protein CAOG_03530 [Capsaspora owczarzaki ATCC 30864]|uniref:CUB domain-containing protein n=1 Tax=Capsaspora owczarzaki (strain ATCC 30864) TaxID=595528 RepID=A0A0D2X2I2_CAPO3|nr:hypothetical protein CAOG_03530 [Capsaspora owczarzaki ATCC 30864]KJE92604.1 hypothetical protein CAOG_003530 [Capsaspora owczarzaki ATCC 30864]|eukprot:XP_004348435.1 hypothetical protein CAOG_03530 [Capsaspora owczarzaki ATCC 30864]